MEESVEKNVLVSEIANESFNTKKLTDKQLHHLLNRTLLGSERSDFTFFRDKPLSAITKRLLGPCQPDNGPLKDYSAINTSVADFHIKFGTSWATDRNYDPAINLKRRNSLKNWELGLFYSHTKSIRPKMTLFWQNIFLIQVQKITLANNSYQYVKDLFCDALGNFSTLFVKQVTSFALLESHRKSLRTSKGLYKSYAIHVLSNYLFGTDCSKYLSRDKINYFTRILHEWSIMKDCFLLEEENNPVLAEKILSADYFSIASKKYEILDSLTELMSFTKSILEHDIVASTMATRLFKWFVSTKVDFEGYSHIIKPVAENLLTKKFNVKKMVECLIQNEYFYHFKYCDTMYKSPIDFLFGVSRQLQLCDIKEANHIDHYPYWEWMQSKVKLLHHQAPEQTLDFAGPGNFPISQRELNAIQFSKGKNIILEQFAERINFNNRFMQNDILRTITNLPGDTSLEVFIRSIGKHLVGIQCASKQILVWRNEIYLKYQITGDEWNEIFTANKEKKASVKMKAGMLSIVKDIVVHFLSIDEYQYH